MTDKEKTSREALEIAIGAANEKKAKNIVVMNMQKVFPVTDYFLIASGNSTVQVQAVADSIEEKMDQAGIVCLHKEGYREGRWVLLDYGDVVAHIFVDEERQFYNLEQLWASAPIEFISAEPQ